MSKKTKTAALTLITVLILSLPSSTAISDAPPANTEFAQVFQLIPSKTAA